MKIPSDLQSFAEMVQTKRHQIKTNEQMRKDCYVFEKTKLAVGKEQGWRRKKQKP